MDKEDVVYIYTIKYYLPLKKRNLAVCDNMDGSREYYPRCNKSDKERQKLNDFTWMWNLKNKTNKTK